VTAAEPEFKENIVAKVETPVVEAPKAEVAVTEPVVAVEQAKEREAKTMEYIVKAGDCLSKIAERITGHWRLCYKIAKDNNIKDPDLIFPGQKIVIRK
jgi:nucleoid-associated protein YgaU